MSQYSSIHLRDGNQIRCEHQIHEHQPQGYPVLILEGPWGSLTIFPGIERLERLHAAIGAYLAAHRRPVPAEACTGAAVDHEDCDHPGGDCVHERGAAVDVDELITSIFE